MRVVFRENRIKLQSPLVCGGGPGGGAGASLPPASLNLSCVCIKWWCVKQISKELVVVV
jgi:hypothetical protein